MNHCLKRKGRGTQRVGRKPKISVRDNQAKKKEGLNNKWEKVRMPESKEPRDDREETLDEGNLSRGDVPPFILFRKEGKHNSPLG